MDITIFPGKLEGRVTPNPSKSQAHRAMLCAALADQPTRIEIPTICDDLVATIGCISDFGGEIEHCYGQAEIITPIGDIPSTAICNCGESGATLRFMLPLAASLGIDTIFLLEGRLPYRPLSPLWEEMERHGCRLNWLSREQLHKKLGKMSYNVTAGLHLSGRLRPGHYRLDGNVSSQFVSGLLMSLPLLEGQSQVELIGPVESRPYIDMTLDVLRQFGIHWEDFCITGPQKPKSPTLFHIEADWSNAAFWLSANALGSHIQIAGLNEDSVQGDKAIVSLLHQLQNNMTISAADIPDLVPILAVIAAFSKGATITDIRRLRLKESDRVASVVEMIRNLGGQAQADENAMTIFPVPLRGGIVDGKNDHRIAMAAAIASTACDESVTILGAECVRKSYPGFWKEFSRLGGKI